MTIFSAVRALTTLMADTAPTDAAVRAKANGAAEHHGRDEP